MTVALPAFHSSTAARPHAVNCGRPQHGTFGGEVEENVLRRKSRNGILYADLREKRPVRNHAHGRGEGVRQMHMATGSSQTPLRAAY